MYFCVLLFRSVLGACRRRQTLSITEHFVYLYLGVKKEITIMKNETWRVFKWKYEENIEDGKKMIEEV